MNTIPPLSEAIRLGAMLLPQSKRAYFEGPVDAPTACCATGGAALAFGYNRESDWITQFLNRLWPIVLVEVPHPLNDYKQTVGTIIDTLNYIGWTRERIADWVATIEPQEAEAVGEEAVCQTPSMIV